MTFTNSASQAGALNPQQLLREIYGKPGLDQDDRWHFLLNNAPAFIIVIDLNADIVFINHIRPQFKMEDVLGGNAFDFIAPESHDTVRKAIEQARATGTTVSYECACLDPDGRKTWFASRVGGLYRDEQLLGFMIYATDITERKKVEESLQMQARVLESMAEGVLLCDDTGKILHTNPAFDRMFGYDSGELCAQHVDVLNRDPDCHHAVIDALQKHGKWFGEFNNKRKDGTPFTTRARISAIQISGRVLWVSVQEDITEQKRTEESLRQAQKMEAIGKLAGGVAHDFNHLMMIIMGNCEIMRGAVDSRNPLQVNLDEIAKAAERAANLTSQLLAFSRKQVQQPRPLNLNFVVSDMQNLLRRLCAPTIDLAIHLDPNLGVVRADPGQIEQVIMNLVLNARDAMPHGGKLFIESEDILLSEALVNRHVNIRPGSYVTLSVTDTGCGMTDDILSRIFEPFFTTKEPGKGTGLGLATVYGIVKQSGGEVWVDSRAGKGSRFQIFLPRAAGGTSVERPAVKPSPVVVENSARGTILFAEDDDRLRALVSDYLTSRGYEVLTADTGAQALEICRHHCGPIHVVLSDVMMPQMSGPELVRRIREQRREIRVIYMSGFTNNETAAAEIAKSEAGFVQKPITLDALRLKIDEVMNTLPAEVSAAGK